VFPNALGNTIETQRRRLNIGLLLWGCFCDFFSYFFLNEGKQTPIRSLLQVLLQCSLPTTRYSSMTTFAVRVSKKIHLLVNTLNIDTQRQMVDQMG
jgi:hypothetical protein